MWLSLLISTGAVRAATWTVAADGTGDHTEVEDAIGAAASGDRIEIGEGTWYGCLDTGGKDLELVGAGSGLTILDGARACDTTFRVVTGETVRLSGVTLRNLDRRGLEVVDSVLTASDITFEELGWTGVDGAGAWVTRGELSISDCRAEGLRAERGFFRADTGSTLEIDGCELTGLESDWYTLVFATYGSLVRIRDSRITDFTAGYAAIRLYDDVYSDDDKSSVELSGNTFSGGSSYRAVLSMSYGSSLSTTGDRFEGHDGTIIEGSSIDLACDGSTFAENTDGPVISTQYGGELSLSGCRFEGNEGEDAGAIQATGDAQLVVEGCSFVDNRGTMGPGDVGFWGDPDYGETDHGYVEITASSFSGSSSALTGGCLAASQAQRGLVVRDSHFEGCTAGSGGAIYVYEPAVSIEGSTFVDNEATDGRGGAMALGYQQSGGYLEVRDSLFSGNRAGDDGGAISMLKPHDMVLDHVRFVANFSGSNGGAVEVDGLTSLTVQGCDFVGNEARNRGGGLEMSTVQLREVSLSRFCGNQAHGGGAVWTSAARHGVDRWTNLLFVENEALSSSGGMQLDGGSSTELMHISFVGNSAIEDGSALSTSTGDLTVVNVAFTDQVGAVAAYAIDADPWDSGQWTYDGWYGNALGDAGGLLGDVTAQEGAVAADPLWTAFVADGDCGTDDLHPAVGSPLIDAGDPTLLDADGSRSDIGAFGGEGAGGWDVDGDGWLVVEDCDDDDATVYPGATEILDDGIDQDCDWADATAGGDGGAEDGGAEDGGAEDGGATDGGATDGGAEDGGATDGGAEDGGAEDGGSADGGATDGGSTDGGDEDLDGGGKTGCGSGGSGALLLLPLWTLALPRRRRDR